MSGSRKWTAKCGSTPLPPADGWTAKVTKDDDRRSTVRLTNTETGERVVVTGWLNKKGVLKSRVR